MDGGAARFIYSADYYCDIGEHVFPTRKYRMLHRLMLDEGLAGEEDFQEPQPAARDDLELVHTPQYVDDLLAARRTRRTERSEMPISHDIVRAFVLGCGGSILAARRALEHRTATMNLAGGFHHAFPDHAEGFCYINDVAVAVERLRRDGLVGRAMVVDCDLHQGNGTAAIFGSVPEVFTFSIHQHYLYPLEKERSDADVGLPLRCTGREYLARLREKLLPALEEHNPEFVLYVAGADPYRGDLLGNLQLEIEDLRERDQFVLGACAKRAIPVAVVLAGGYAALVEDTVRIHFGTAETLLEVADEYPGAG